MTKRSTNEDDPLDDFDHRRINLGGVGTGGGYSKTTTNM
jgi:hypothetical protein